MRLFLGFAPDSGEGRTLYALCERLDLDELVALRWVPPENWHLTLAFLGEVPNRQLGQLVEAVQEALSGAAPCEQPLDRLSWFPAPEKARMLVLEGTAVEPLQALQRACAAALGRAGFGLERRAFRPHLTLARYRGSRRRFSPPALPPILPISLTLDCLVLFQSLPGQGAPVYQPVHQFELGR